MASIYRINESDLTWFDFEPGIRVKPLTRGRSDLPSMQYLEYGPGHTDPVHSHDTDEVFIVITGELRLEGIEGSSGPGGVVFIPRDTPYAVSCGPEGVRYFRVVVS
jgi:quercetin dioxygenase-like cupin family protein